ncbi:ATP-binding protein [Allohahella marinimesophila]|uniref:histidine kinase n=1 Tax=Allohahella marinimesophila TaxID=1054972 RepID=A0ABP7Q2J1_9GAMM
MPVRFRSLSLFSIRARLALVLAGTALLIAVGLFLAFQQSFRSGFVAYLNDAQQAHLIGIVEELIDQEPAVTDWERLMRSPKAWREALASAGDRPRRKRGPGRLALFDANGEQVFGRQAPENDFMQAPIMVEDQLVGYIGAPVLRQASNAADRVFLTSQTQLFLLWTLVAMLLSAALAIPVAGYLTRRLERISTAVQRLAARDYSVRLAPVTQDELGQLAAHVNLCAETLSRYQSQQQRWLVDISHELRTPLSILRAEIEAMIDGVRPLSQDGLVSLQSEVLMLTGLVTSLHQLSVLEEQAEGGATEFMAARDLINFVQTKLASLEAGVSNNELRVGLSMPGQNDAHNRLVSLGMAQIEQVINNLWQNTRRYTDAPGRLQVELSLTPSRVILRWEDSAPGVSNDQLPLVFDRLWRDEQSRNRALGGSGLGLAICKALVESAGGKITAGQSTLGGLTIVITLPLRPYS